MVGIGLVLQVGIGLAIAALDDNSASKKICFHLSEQEVEVFQQHRVIFGYSDSKSIVG